MYCTIITNYLILYSAIGTFLETTVGIGWQKYAWLFRIIPTFLKRFLHFQTESIGLAAYECQWYDTHPRLRLALMHIIRASRNPESFTAFGVSTINNVMIVNVRVLEPLLNTASNHKIPLIFLELADRILSGDAIVSSGHLTLFNKYIWDHET